MDQQPVAPERFLPPHLETLSDKDLLEVGETLTALHYELEQALKKITDEAVRRGLEERREPATAPDLQ